MAGYIEQVVLKIASRCNLNCSYCYMYNHGDKSYLDRPRFISDETFDGALRAMHSYCERRKGHRIGILFHGGEPTLVGARRFDELARRAINVLGKRLKGLAIQTNAVLVDDDWVEVLQRHHVSLGISLDGPPEVHDLVRVDHAGRGSHHATIDGLRKLQQAGLEVYVLSVISPRQSGLRVYNHLRELGITNMDFLMPDVTHDSKLKWYGDFGPTPVADFLLPIFNAWIKDGDPNVRIRIFTDLLQLITGGHGAADAFGNYQMRYLVVETDGSIEALDVLRVCSSGIQRSGLNVKNHDFDELDQGLPLLNELIHNGMPLSTICQECPECSVCGGGYLPHRYAAASGFDNPSVWCADILKLIAHIRRHVGNTRLSTRRSPIARPIMNRGV